MLSLIFPYEVKITPDLWFNADIERVINSLAIPNEASRLNIHPLLALIILQSCKTNLFWGNNDWLRHRSIDVNSGSISNFYFAESHGF